MFPAHTRRKGSSSPDQESKRLAGPFLPDIEAVRKQVAGMVKNGIEKNTFFFLYFFGRICCMIPRFEYDLNCILMETRKRRERYAQTDRIQEYRQEF